MTFENSKKVFETKKLFLDPFDHFVSVLLLLRKAFRKNWLNVTSSKSIFETKALLKLIFIQKLKYYHSKKSSTKSKNKSEGKSHTNEP